MRIRNPGFFIKSGLCAGIKTIRLTFRGFLIQPIGIYRAIRKLETADAFYIDLKNIAIWTTIHGDY